MLCTAPASIGRGARDQRLRGDQRKAAVRRGDRRPRERIAAVEARAAASPAGGELAVRQQGAEAGLVELAGQLRGEFLDAQHVDVVLANEVDERLGIALAELHVGGQDAEGRPWVALRLRRAAERARKDGPRRGARRRVPRDRRHPVAHGERDRERDERGQRDVRRERHHGHQREARFEAEQADRGPQRPAADEQPADDRPQASRARRAESRPTDAGGR